MNYPTFACYFRVFLHLAGHFLSISAFLSIYSISIPNIRFHIFVRFFQVRNEKVQKKWAKGAYIAVFSSISSKIRHIYLILARFDDFMPISRFVIFLKDLGIWA